MNYLIYKTNNFTIVDMVEKKFITKDSQSDGKFESDEIELWFMTHYDSFSYMIEISYETVKSHSS